MTKKEKLEKLDKQVLDLMLNWTTPTEDDITGDIIAAPQTERLTELSVAVNYLKSNAVVEEKAKGTVEEDVKKRRAAAKKRRERGESE